MEIPVTDEMREEHQVLENIFKIYSNSRYEVHLFACSTAIGGVMQVTVARHFTKEEIPWDDMQRVKVEIFGEQAWALEIFPDTRAEWHPQKDVRVMWVMPSDYEVPFGLHRPESWGRS